MNTVNHFNFILNDNSHKILYLQLFKYKSKLVYTNLTKNKDLSLDTKNRVKKVLNLSNIKFKKDKNTFTQELKALNNYKDLEKDPSLKLLTFKGTSFQEKVWLAIKEIPYGKTLSYGELAKKIKHPKACRAVGTACGKNPLPVFIPCHRVLASNGIGGFGNDISVKKQLLQMEHIL